MNQCLRITLSVKEKNDIFRLLVKKHACKFKLEGTIQDMMDKKIKIVACGLKLHMEMFLDVLHQEVAKKKIDEIEIEPFLKNRDYRGVFRVIE